MKYWMNVVADDSSTMRLDVADADMGLKFISRNIGITNIPPLKPTAPAIMPTIRDSTTKMPALLSDFLVDYCSLFTASSSVLGSSISLLGNDTS